MFVWKQDDADDIRFGISNCLAQGNRNGTCVLLWSVRQLDSGKYRWSVMRHRDYYSVPVELAFGYTETDFRAREAAENAFNSLEKK